MRFDPTSKEKIRQLESEKIRAMADFFYSQRIPVTYFGKAWSGCTNNWIYFDTILDLEGLKKDFQLDANFEIHENLDPKSGMERGFIDKRTGEGVMGKVS